MTRAVLPLAVLLALLLTAPPALALGRGSGGGLTDDAVRILGDVESTFPAGAVHVRDLEDGFSLDLSAKDLAVEYHEESFFTFAENDAAALSNLQGVERPVNSTDRFFDARLSLSLPSLEDAPTVLVFTEPSTWPGTRPSGAELHVATQDTDCAFELVRKATLVTPPQHAQRGRTFGDEAFEFQLPVPAFAAGAADQAGRAKVEGSGYLSIYVWGFDVDVSAGDRRETYETGQRTTYAQTQPAATHNVYSYVLIRARDASLVATPPARSTAWYAPEPVVNVVGTVAAEWRDAAMDAGGRRYAADGAGTMQGSFALRPRQTIDGPSVRWEGDVTATTFRPEAYATAPLSASPTTAVVLQLALLILVLATALAAARWRRGERRAAEALPELASTVGAPPVVVAAPLRRQLSPAIAPAAPAPTVAPLGPAAPAPALVAPPGPKPTAGSTKDNVLRIIERKPGIHLASAASELDIPRSIAFHHVHDLERRGLVFSVPVQGRYALFRVGHWTAEDANAQAALTSPRTREVGLLLLGNPGVTIAALVDRTGMPGRSVARELQRLRARGLALRDMLARPAKYHPSDRLRRLAQRAGATPEAVVLAGGAEPSGAPVGTNGHGRASINGYEPAPVAFVAAARPSPV